MSRSYASNIELSKEIKNLIRKYEEIKNEEHLFKSVFSGEKLSFPNIIIDETKSVEWNRREIEQINQNKYDYLEKFWDEKYEKMSEVLEEISLIFENKYGLNSKIIQNLFHYLKRIEIEFLRDNGVKACIIDIEKLTVDVAVLLEVLAFK